MNLLLIVFLMVTLLVGIFPRMASGIGLVDKPNERSSHTTPTPRGAGMVFVLIWALGAGYLLTNQDQMIPQGMALIAGASLVAAVGLWDDFRGLSARVRLLCHLVAAGILMFYLLANKFDGLDALWLGIGLSVAIAWSINLFNFMDGIDGIAGLEALFVLGAGGWWFYGVGEAEWAQITWLVATAVAGFLVWNWPKAKVFMGDVGSGFLGFLIGALTVIAFFKDPKLGVCWIVMYGVFLADTMFTLIRRILRGERWYAAHRSHAYQRLQHVGGWSHRKILSLVIAINMMLLLISSALYKNVIVMGTSIGLAGILLFAYLWIVEKIAPIQPLSKTS